MRQGGEKAKNFVTTYHKCKTTSGDVPFARGDRDVDPQARGLRHIGTGLATAVEVKQNWLMV